MDYLWTPWRYRYVTDPRRSATGRGNECVFCSAAASAGDRDALIVYRAKWNFIIVNRFPYTSGHVMVVPYQHAPSLLELPAGCAFHSRCGLAVERCRRERPAVRQIEGAAVACHLA